MTQADTNGNELRLSLSALNWVQDGLQ